VFPQQLAHFEIVRRLGEGGMAEVFLAKKRGAEGTYKVLVVKRILPGFGTSRRFKSMFIEEAQLATRLNHPNVVQVYDFFDAGDEGHVLSMEYVEGCDLGHLMSAAKAKGTRIPSWVAAWIIAEAAKGLHYAHEKKDESGQPLDIVHRDVSPQNVLLSLEGVVKIADFGIASARLFREEVGVLKGKFGYMSPEQARGERVDRRSDLYSLGVILWECLVGRPLHGGLGGEALLDMVRTGQVEPPSTHAPSVPSEIETIVMKLLAPRPEGRFDTARDVTAAIGRAFIQRGELVDASALEAAMLELVDKDAVASVAAAPQPREHATQAAAPEALSAGEGPARPHTPTSLQPASRRAAPEAREVRHVAVVTLRLVPDRDPGEVGHRAAFDRALERLRAMLGEMAYKHGTRWVFTSDLEARAIAGLTAKPARAAQDASSLALETHEAIAGIREDLPIPLRASISIVRGIASGARDSEGNLVRYTLHEPATFLADTLSLATPLAATWVAGGVYRLVRREFRWADAPTLDLPGDGGVPNLPPQMRIYALERSLSREERQAELASMPSDLVGRDAERAELSAAFHAAVTGAGGAGQLVCRAVVGELGIGKSALVGTFTAELHAQARVVRVECMPVKQEIAFSTVAELVRVAVGASGEEPFEEVARLIGHVGGGAAQGDGASPVVARLAELATNRRVAERDDDDAHYQRKLVVSGVRQLTAALALQQPLVVVIEGLQWADKASLDLFTELTRHADPLPILVVLVTRPDDRLAAILEDKVRIVPTGLTGEEQVRLLETRLGVREGVGPVCAELSPRVGGNPFYLLEIVDALLERGAIEIQGDALVRAARAEQGFHELPSTLEQLLADRIAELPGPERIVVDWLAIAAGPLAVADVQKLTRARDDEAIVRLCARGLCDRRGVEVDFRHPLTRDVAYAALDPLPRVRMHRELGEHLAETSLARGVSAAIVARHLAKGEAYPQAARLYVEAATAARAGYQSQLAVRYFQRAASYLPAEDPLRLEAHDSLEALFRVLGRRAERVRHLAQVRHSARLIATPKAAALALHRTSRFHLEEGNLDKGLPIARQAAQLAHAAAEPQLEIEAELIVCETLRELGDVQGALAAVDRALAACNPKVNPHVPRRVRAEVLRARGVLLRRVGRVREAVDSYVDAIAVFRRAGARRQEARAKNALAYAMFVQGRYEDAIALALETIQIDLSIGGRFQLAKTLTNIGHSYARLGDTPRALAYLRRAIETHVKYDDWDSYADTLIVTAEVQLELGELDQAEEQLHKAEEVVRRAPYSYDKTHLALIEAALARQRRDAKTAIEKALLARRTAETQALVAYHFYAFAIEAAARVDAGEVHSATLLATTALGAVENLQGCEYGLEIRVLCADALKRAASPQASGARQRAVDYAAALMNTIRDARLRRLFVARPFVATLLDNTPVPIASAPAASGAPAIVRHEMLYTPALGDDE